MSRRRSPRAARLATAAVAVALVASGAGAQPAPPAADTVAEGSWRSRVGVGVRWGQLQPAGGSELYALLDRALEAALAPPVRTPAAEALVGDLRRAAVTITDVEGLADHLVASGYRKGAPS